MFQLLRNDLLPGPFQFVFEERLVWVVAGIVAVARKVINSRLCPQMLLVADGVALFQEA